MCFFMECEKSFISVLDNDARYMIAEAIRGASLNQPIENETDSTSPTGIRALNLAWDVSQYAL